jgi:hypothetical protein
MNSSAPYAERTKLRALVATMEREISRVARPITTDQGATQTNGLLASWAVLVESLALGPEPELGHCPFCNHLIMRAATRCRDCWRQLPGDLP